MLETELDRADRFHFSKDRDSYTVAHAALRLLLGEYLGVEPFGLEFVHGAHGKPSLAGDSAAVRNLRFNLSHSHEIALLCVSLRELFPGHNYRSAIAVESHNWRLRCWDWPGQR